MTDNPIRRGLDRGPHIRLTAEQWADKGNEHLARIGRFDVHWFVHNGRCTIGHRDTSPVWPDRRIGTDATR